MLKCVPVFKDFIPSATFSSQLCLLDNGRTWHMASPPSHKLEVLRAKCKAVSMPYVAQTHAS